MIPSAREIFFKLTLMSVLITPAFGADSPTIDMNKMTTDQMNDACIKEGQGYGVRKLKNGQLSYRIHPECRRYIESFAKEKQKSISDEKDVRVLAGLNIIYIDIDATIKDKNNKDKKITRKHIISGPMAKLSNIESVVLSKDHKKVAILHRVPKGWGTLKDNRSGEATNEHVEKEIKVFDATLNGNVAPLYILRDKEINKARNITFTPSGDEILMINEKTNQIITFSTKTDYRRKNEKLRPKSLRKISPSGTTFREPASIDFINNTSLLVLDANNSNVVALDPLSNKAQWVLDGETIGLNQVAHINYNEKDKKLTISDDTGNQVIFDKE